MPSASAKLEKQASTEANDSIKQGITIIEHKIRNLEKRKSRLEAYRDQQSSGKELNSDQLAAIAKYDEVLQTLEFARDLCKQFMSIAGETAKQQKKQARKDVLEKAQQDLAKVKEVLLIQDVLANMGQDSVREDFLAGRNGAVKLTEENLQFLDDLFTHVSPKREVEEGSLPFPEQVQKAAEHLVSLAEGKNKEVVGTTYAQLRQLIHDIHTCGYFDSSSPVIAVPEATGEAPCEEEDAEGEEEPMSVPSTTFQPSKPVVPPAAQPAVQPSQQLVETVDQSSVMVIPSQPAVNEVISSVMAVGNSSFHFLQESELDSPDVIVPTAPPPSALPIPTQTFTNQNFSATSAQPYGQKPVQQAAQAQQQQPVYAAIPIPNPLVSFPTPYTAAAPQHQHPSTYQQQQPPPQQQPQPHQQSQPQPQVEHIADWSEATANTIESSDWNTQCEAAATSPDSAWQQPKHHHQNSWATESAHNTNNDGFVTAGRGGGGRGGRGRGGNSRGGPRGGGGGRSGSGGSGNYYRNNSSNDNGYYQSNGYQHRNSGSGDRRGPGNGGLRGGPRSDRGGPRGGGGRGGRGGNRQQQQ